MQSIQRSFLTKFKSFIRFFSVQKKLPFMIGCILASGAIYASEIQDRLGPELPYLYEVPGLAQQASRTIQACTSYEDLDQAMQDISLLSAYDHSAIVNDRQKHEMTSKNLDVILSLYSLQKTAADKFDDLFFDLGFFPHNRELVLDLAFHIYDSLVVIGEYIINLNDSNLIKKLDDYAETIEVPQMKSAADCWEFFKSIYQDVCHHEPDPRLETLILASPATCDFFCVEHTYADIASYSTAEVWEQVMGQADCVEKIRREGLIKIS